MKTRIVKIEMKNFRQYRDNIIEFENNKENDLHVFIAQNGIGKTTFLNAITWCLYGNEYHLSDGRKALQVVNDKALTEAKQNEVLEVIVVLTIDDEDRTLKISRMQKYKVKENEFGFRRTISDSGNLTVVISYKEKFKNPEIKENADADIVIKQYFDENIRDFYFFDGEKLKDFFNIKKSNMIKESIFNISQITLLENCIKRTRTISDDKLRLGKKNEPNIEENIQKKLKLELENSRCEDTINQCNLELPLLLSRKEEVDSDLKSYNPIKHHQENREIYEGQLEEIKESLIEFNAEKNEFIRKYIVLLNLYPGIKASYELILNKEQTGNLPPEIDKDQVKKILDDNICTVCHNHITEEGRKHLYELLNSLAVTSKTSNYLMEIKSSLKEMINETLEYVEIKNKILNKEKKIIKKKKDIEKKLEDISAFLSKFSSDAINRIDVQSLEKERKRLEEDIIDKKTLVNTNLNIVRRNMLNIEILEKELENNNAKSKQNKKHINQSSLYKKANQVLSQIKTNIMSKIKDDIQNITWVIFSKMIWKKSSFKSLEISEEYEIIVYNKEDREVTGSLSATEQMALAYAFTLGVHYISGKNCPLVIDSPLGRVSDKNRINTATELLKISRDKQIIMLFTPDEYNETIERIYTDINSNITDIKMSEDEQEIISFRGDN